MENSCSNCFHVLASHIHVHSPISTEVSMPVMYMYCPGEKDNNSSTSTSKCQAVLRTELQAVPSLSIIHSNFFFASANRSVLVLFFLPSQHRDSRAGTNTLPDHLQPVFPRSHECHPRNTLLPT